jgi:hypothetical protein
MAYRSLVNLQTKNVVVSFVRIFKDNWYLFGATTTYLTLSYIDSKETLDDYINIKKSQSKPLSCADYTDTITYQRMLQDNIYSELDACRYGSYKNVFSNIIRSMIWPGVLLSRGIASIVHHNNKSVE